MTVSSIVLESFLDDIRQIEGQCSTILSTAGSEDNVLSEGEHRITDFAHDLGRVLHAGCTKLAIASKPPLCSSTVEACILSLQKELPAIAALCRLLRPDVYGEALCERIRLISKRTLAGLSTLIETVCMTAAEDRLGRTGVVWDACQELQKLPSNGTLVLTDIQNSNEMLDDAIDELQSWLRGDAEEDVDSSDLSGHDEDLESPFETVHKPTVRDSAKETEQRIVMLKRIQLLLKAMKKQAAKATLPVEQSNSVHRILKPLIAEIDDLAGEIQERSDEALIQELEKAVVIRVDELSYVMTRNVGDEKWLAWINTFRKNWLVASKSSPPPTGK